MGINEFLPDNLKVDFGQMCNNCPYIDISHEDNMLYSDVFYNKKVDLKISCSHIKACRWAYTKGLKDG